MITNSSIQILLRKSPTSVDLVQQTLKLSDEEKYLLLESDVGEGIFFAGLKHVAIKVIASYTEDQIITSDPSQILAIKKAKQELEASQGQLPGDTPAGIPLPRQSPEGGGAPRAPERPSSPNARGTSESAAIQGALKKAQEAAATSIPQTNAGV
ncbi:hypothetical protein HY417_02780 [Candidatus Kaiserbacteria bacterium]|nr:hypothetical protein [Candidatus Kaiserbacteria bacterium]